MTKDLIFKYLAVYIIAIVSTIIMCLGEYPLSFMILILSIVTSIIITRIKYYNDGKRYIIFALLWSLLCLGIFLMLLMVGSKADLIREIMLYTL